MDYYDYIENDDEPPWECFLCGREEDFDIAPFGWIGDVHPLCRRCADTLFHDHNHIRHNSLSYHYKAGEISVFRR